MNIGTIQRAAAALVVFRGWDPNGTTKRETVAPLAAGSEGYIESGMVCSLRWNSTTGVEEFIKGVPDSSLATAHFAKYDYTEDEIQSSGLFSALSCADDYELGTPHYKAADTYLFGSFLVPDGVTGDVKVSTTDVGGTSASSIIGQVTKGNGPIDVGPEGLNSNSNTAVDANGKVLLLCFQTRNLRIDAAGS